MQIVYDILLEQIDYIIQYNIFYYAIFGLLLMIVNLLIFYKINKDIKHEIKTINFILTFLPFEKWKDDVTYHLLK